MKPHPDTWGCPACLAARDPEDAWAALTTAGVFGSVAALVEESHFGVTVLACSRCGQQCAKVFIEFVDWSGGDDAQYWTLLPLTPAEAQRVIAEGEDAGPTLESLSRDGRRQLHVDYPTGGTRRCYWSDAPLMIFPGG